MNNRDKIVRFYAATEGAEVAVRLVDLAETVARGRKYKTTAFLDPFGAEIAQTVAAHYDGVKVDFNGGYDGAERQRAVFVHDDFPGRPDWQLAAVRMSWSGEHYHLTHRDVLGALLGLGLERDRLGDIILDGDAAIAVTDNQMQEFILRHLTQIGAATVETGECSLDKIPKRVEKCKEIFATVASLRVDAVAAAGFGSSRSKLADAISADRVKVNWQAVKNGAATVKEGDVISLRGRGRVEIAQLRGATKKGRIGVLLKRYI